MTSDALPVVQLFAISPQVLRSGQGINWLTYLGIEEQRKAAEYRNPEEAIAFIIQQALMRVMAASALGVRPTEAAHIPVDRSCRLCTARAEHGKPRIRGINFNMGRSNGLVAGAFLAQDMTTDDAIQLGVDVERLRGSFFEGYDSISLTPSEAKTIGEASPESAQLLRLMLRVGKEAALKALGEGLPAGLNKVHFSLREFPATIEEVSGFQTQAQFYPSAGEVKTFYIRWVTQGEFFLALATDQPVAMQYHPVHTPLEIKRHIQGH